MTRRKKHKSRLPMVIPVGQMEVLKKSKSKAQSLISAIKKRN